MVSWGSQEQVRESYLSIFESITQMTLIAWLLRCVRKRKASPGTELLDVGKGLRPPQRSCTRASGLGVALQETALAGGWLSKTEVGKNNLEITNKLRTNDTKIMEDKGISRDGLIKTKPMAQHFGIYEMTFEVWFPIYLEWEDTQSG